MANDNTGNQGNDSRKDQDPTRDTFPGNPNRQNQNTPGQQQGAPGVKKQPDSSRLHDDERSVTDRTIRKSVIDHRDDNDGEIDRLKG